MDSDLGQHLRTIHFALLATSFAVLVTASLQPTGDLVKAIDECDAAEKINRFLTAQRIVGLPNMPKLATRDSISRDDIARNIEWVIGTGHYAISPSSEDACRLWVPFAGRYYCVPSDLPAVFAQAPSQRSLADFRTAWRFLESGKDAFVIRGLSVAQAKVTSNTPSAQTHLEWGWSGGAPSMPVQGVIALSAESPDVVAVAADMQGNFGAYESRTDLFQVSGKAQIPAVIDRRATNLPALILPIDLLGGPTELGAEAESFEARFFNMNVYMKGLEPLGFPEFRAYLQRLSSAKGQELQFYGVPVPQRLLAVWGVVVLLTLQIYFNLHLGQVLREPASLKHDAAWIALYPATSAKVVTITSLLLPVLANAALLRSGWRTWGTRTSQATLSIAVAISLWLFVVTIRKLRRIV
jgi:hypothetical protein